MVCIMRFPHLSIPYPCSLHTTHSWHTIFRLIVLWPVIWVTHLTTTSTACHLSRQLIIRFSNWRLNDNIIVQHSSCFYAYCTFLSCALYLMNPRIHIAHADSLPYKSWPGPCINKSLHTHEYQRKYSPCRVLLLYYVLIVLVLCVVCGLLHYTQYILE